MTERIGSYELTTLLGRGATSDVYRARHVTLEREDAVKVLLPRLVDRDDDRAAFLRESRLVARLDHPNIVTVHEAGEHDGAVYIAMSLIDGQNLSELIASAGPLSLDETLRIGRQVAAALDAAHAEGLVHRDVKPSNILISRDGTAYLSDFGLTKVLDSSSRISGAGVLVGSIPYMAPEQLEGRGVGRPTDVYSFACVLYECLTRRPPFVGTSDIEVLWAHIQENPTAPSRHNPSLRHIDRALLRGLAKDPEERPRSATELVELVAGAATRRMTWRPTIRFPARAVAQFAAVAVAAGAVTLAGAVGPQVEEPDRARGARVGEQQTPNRAKDPSREARSARRPSGRDVKKETVAAPAAEEALETPELVPSTTDVDPLLAAAPDPGELPRPRVLSRSYDASVAPLVDCAAPTEDQVGCVEFDTESDERHIFVSIRDQTELPIRAWIRQDRDRDGDFDGDWIEICAETDRLVPVAPGAIVNISIETGSCRGEGNSVPTSGLVTVSLYKAGR